MSGEHRKSDHWASYVAHSHINKAQDIETLLLKDGISEKACEMFDKLIRVSEMENRVDVLAPYYDVRVNRIGLTAFGTSFATPRVAALAANILAINPRLMPADVERIITSTATPIAEPKGRTRAGVINEKKALEAAKESLSSAN